MTLDQLLAVRSIAQAHSLAQAAQKSHLSASSLSRTLRSLEEELGTELFWRNGRHLVLNEYGKIIVHHANMAEGIMTDALEDIRAMAHHAGDLLKVYFRQSLGNTGAVLAPFIRMNPDVRLDIILSRNEASAEGFDMEFVSTPSPDPEAISLCTERYVLVVGRGHHLAGAQMASLRQLRGETFIVLPAQNGGQSLIDACRRCGFLPSKRLECPQTWSALHCVEQNMGIMLAPELYMLAGLESDVVKVPLDDDLPPRHLCINWGEGYEPTATAWDFVSFLKGYFAH